MNWNERSGEKEELDDLNFSGPELEQSLDELSWVHRYLGGHNITIRTLQNALDRIPKEYNRPIRVLDAACGGGDSLRSMAKWAKRRKINLEFFGVDGNPSTIEYARNKSHEFSNINYKTEDLFSKNMDWSHYDIVMFALILHHFSDEQIKQILQSCHEANVAVIAVNDLHRHPWAYHLFGILSKITGFSHVSRNDGLRSIKKAFTKEELQKHFEQSGYNEYKISWRWAFRYEAIAKRRNH
jgi:2-polyprenyl-3-methyl-5-hydroxy-6-metoxy-1,4-benzoquinol methylase